MRTSGKLWLDEESQEEIELVFRVSMDPLEGLQMDNISKD